MTDASAWVIGAPVQRIEGVGITLAALHEVITVIAGGGNAITVERRSRRSCHLLIVAGFFQRDPPGRAIEFLADGLEFTRGLGEDSYGCPMPAIAQLMRSTV